MSERIPSIDREIMEHADVLLLAPNTFSIVVGIDIRKSSRSLQSVASLPLLDTLKPCAQMPNVNIKTDNLPEHPNLMQLMAQHSEQGQDLLAKLVGYNVINYLNENRDGIEEEQSEAPDTYLYYIPSFTYLKEKTQWKFIIDTVKPKDEGHLLTNLDDFVKKQVDRENNVLGYINGENGSISLWDASDN